MQIQRTREHHIKQTVTKHKVNKMKYKIELTKYELETVKYILTDYRIKLEKKKYKTPENQEHQKTEIKIINRIYDKLYYPHAENQEH